MKTICPLDLTKEQNLVSLSDAIDIIKIINKSKFNDICDIKNYSKEVKLKMIEILEDENCGKCDKIMCILNSKLLGNNGL